MRSVKRLVVLVLTLTVALLIQLTLVNGLDLPGGGVPDLVLLCVVAIGLAGGMRAGLIAGFCAGLALDLAPPGGTLIGLYALVFCLVGYGCGRMTSLLRRSAVLAFAAAGAAAVVGEVFAAGLAVLFDTPQVTLGTVIGVLPSSLLYDLLLCPLALFVAVRMAVRLGLSFNPQDDSPAMESGGSATPLGLAGLAGLRRAPNGAVAGEGAALASGTWLTGDSAAAVAAVGEVGWLRGPARSRRARRKQARLTAALTGAAPRKGAFWVGSRPDGLRHDSAAPAVRAPSAPRRLHPESGVAGSATRESVPGTAPRAPAVRIDFRNTGSAKPSAGDRVGDGTPKIAFGGGGLPGSGRPARGGSPRIRFGHGELSRRPRPRPGVPKIAFGTGGTPGAGAGGRRKVPRIAFGNGLPRGIKTSPGRPALPRFRRGSSRSASGSWLAAARQRSTALRTGGPGRGSGFYGGGSSYGMRRSHWPKAAKMRRRRRSLRWLRRLRSGAGSRRRLGSWLSGGDR